MKTFNPPLFDNRYCCGDPKPHCHCGGDKGHSILPGCPGYVDPWRPIATAPEGSAPVLVWDGSCITVAHRFGREWMVDNAHGYCEDGQIYDVTHWMPLPEAPK